MLQVYQIDALEAALTKSIPGLIVWPRMTSPIQYINSAVGAVTAKHLPLGTGDNIVIRLANFLKEHEHTNFAYYNMGERSDFVDEELIIRSIFGIRFASW